MPISQAVLEQIFNNAVLAEDPNLAPSLLQGQDLYFKGKAVTQVVATATQETTSLRNDIFPVSASSTMLYKHAANLGIPLIIGATPTYGNVTLVATTGTTSPSTFTIPANTILTNSITGIQYYVTADTVINSGALFSATSIPIQSSLSGKSTYAAPGTVLTFAIPFVLSSSLTISSAMFQNNVVTGQDTPTDSHVSNLIYSYMQYPRGGGSSGDYYQWALQSSPNITQAIIIPTGGNSSAQNYLLVATMGGTSDPEININLAYPISRATSLSTINTCATYISSVRPINDNPQIITVSTFGLSSTTPNYVTQMGLLNPIINLTVSLAPGITLNTSVTGSNGITQTVRQWILQQFRFAILSMPYEGITYNNGQYLLGEQITTILSNALGSSQSFNGYLCSILVNASFTYSDNNVSNILNIPVPDSSQYYIVSNPSTINIIYDIDTTIINITVV